VTAKQYQTCHADHVKHNTDANNEIAHGHWEKHDNVSVYFFIEVLK